MLWLESDLQAGIKSAADRDREREARDGLNYPGVKDGRVNR